MEDSENGSLNCDSCKNLREDHWRIPKECLEAGIEKGCRECVLLKEAVVPFVSFDEVQQVALLVDCALYLQVRKTDKQSPPILVELYIEEGKPTLC